MCKVKKFNSVLILCFSERDGMLWGEGLGPVEIMRALSTQGRAGQADSGWQGELNREIDQDLRL